MSIECLKITRLLTLQKKLKKIKMIIVDCRKQTKRINRNENSILNGKKKNELKSFFEKHNRISKEIIKRYDLIHDKLYGVIEKLYDNDCSKSNNSCENGKHCLDEEENNKLYSIADRVHVEIYDLYNDVENILVTNSELYAHKMNFYISKVYKKDRIEFIKKDLK